MQNCKLIVDSSIFSKVSEQKAVTSVKFLYLTPEEVRKLSAVEVTEMEVFAQLQACPIPGGLYDLRMGPVERGDACKTCALQADCPGHCGHIELACEVYNPFLMKQLYALIKKCCTRCFRFRVGAAVTAKFVEKFELLSRGHELEAGEVPVRMIDESKRPALEREGGMLGASGERNLHWTNASNGSSWSEAFDETRTHSEQAIKHLKDECMDAQRRAHFERMQDIHSDPLLSPSGGMGDHLTSGEIGTWQSLLASYFAEFPLATCENCGLASNTFRVDGYSRIFMKPRKSSREEEKYLIPSYIRNNIVSYLWQNEGPILKYMFPGAGVQKEGVFFLRNVVVPPNKFRPLRSGGGEGMSFLPASTQALKGVMEASEAVKTVLRAQAKLEAKEEAEDAPASAAVKTDKKTSGYSRQTEELGTAIIALQDRVNTYMDSSKSGRSVVASEVKQGVRQLLERKQGLFRMKMMGKRVNYACRSVISPDINLETNQIGLPRFGAIQLSVPEPVFAHNLDYLRKLVINGPDVYPGAVSIDYQDGKTVSLVGRSAKQRESMAKGLFAGSGRVVNRHVRNGDPLLVNRQPTLHKPGIMAMLVRVLQREKTIRMHYVNCNTFNADFDGDEINLHCPQDPVARAEAIYIANADTQFLGPTGGNPLRGLIQDNIGSAALLTGRDTFLTREETFQLVYAAVRAGVEGDVFVGAISGQKVSCVRDIKVRKAGNVQVSGDGLIELIVPAILRPAPMWSGKQVVTIFLRTLIKMCRGGTGLNHTGKSRTPGDLWGGSLDGNKEEETILIRDCELLQGVIDKNSVGANAGGLAHVVYELLGAAAAGLLLTGFSRMVTLFMQWRGFSCCMRDLLIKPDSEKVRQEYLREARKGAWGRLDAWSGGSGGGLEQLGLALAATVRGSTDLPGDLDMMEKLMLGNSSEFWGKTIDAILPGGLVVPFPANNFTAMIMTGAKGSKINQSQIGCLLGQQELEGHRVPLMATMRSHPSFAEFDFSARAGGFVADRFLTGVRPQEFFFHCMAGREGLIDTAVKTARSGYLQRCLVKHMECLVVQYDQTVRDADDAIVQFLYGEDGLDILKSSYLKMPQVWKGNQAFLEMGAVKQEEAADITLTAAYINWIRKRSSDRRRDELLAAVESSATLTASEKQFIALVVKRGDPDPIESVLNPLRFRGAVSNKHMQVVRDVLGEESFSTLSDIFSRKFQASMADAGECVGTLAAQGMGEPSTQMTLNTFHLAGHGGANVTLGIPRLREIVQTAARKISTPSMFIPLGSAEEAEGLKNSLTRVALKDLVKGSTVEESVVCGVSGEKKRRYTLRLDLVDLEKLERVYPSLGRARIEKFLRDEFRAKLDKEVRSFLRLSMQMSAHSQKGHINDDTGMRVGARTRQVSEEGGAENDDDEESPQMNVPKTSSAGGKTRKTDEEVERDSENESDGEGSDAGGQYDDETEAKQKKKDPKKKDTPATPATPTPESSDESDSSDSDSDSSSSEEEAVKAEAAPVVDASVMVDSNAIFGSTGSLVGNTFVIESRELILSDKKVSRKILILEVVEELCGSLFIQQTIGITKVHVTTQNKVGITTEGSNMDFAWSLNGIDHDNIYTNDIGKMLSHYGVEACRQSIIKEIQNVFGHYGISVDVRHLYLIADYMTHQGGFRAFSRGGMEHHSSPFLKMSFETSMKFLSSACHDMQGDSLKSPAAAIVVGKLVPVGTGVFDILNDAAINESEIGTIKYEQTRRKNTAALVLTPHSKRRSTPKHEDSVKTESASKKPKRFTFD